MHKCKDGEATIVKGDKFSKSQFLKNNIEKRINKTNSYASAVERLFYTQLYFRPDIAYLVSALGKFQSNPWLEHCRGVRKQ